MKFFTVFAAIVSVALGSQASWTLPQLSDAIQSPYTDAALLPYLENALNEIMTALHAGQQVEAVSVTIPSIDLSAWTLAELSAALQNPATDAALVPYLEQALNQMMAAIVSEDTQQVAPVIVPAMDVSFWTLQELSAAVNSPATNPALVPYIEHAINEIAHALISGQQMESIVIVTPAGLLQVQESPAPIPIVPAPVESPIQTPVEIPSESPIAPIPSSPLVQIIINVNQQSAGVVPEADKPEPVIVVDQAPTPVQVVDTPAIVEPVQVVETPAVVEPVQVVETPAVVEPVQVVETPAVIEPIIVGTPVIPAVINPVDILHPVPVIQPVIVGAPVVGPIV